MNSHCLVYTHDIVKTSAMDYSGYNQTTWALTQVDDWPEQMTNGSRGCVKKPMIYCGIGSIVQCDKIAYSQFRVKVTIMRRLGIYQGL